MNALAVYPYHYDVDTILNYKELLVNYNITGFSSFKEHKSLVNNIQKKYNLKESKNLEEMLDSAQTLLLCDPIGNFQSSQYAEIIRRAHQTKKEVLISQDLFHNLHGKIQEADKAGILKNEYKTQNEYDADYLLEIPIPVIAVAGLGENCSKFEMQLLIKKVVTDMGYQGEYICTNSLGSLFGMYTLPEFLYRGELTFTEKIILFNHYIYDFCKTQNPDVLVVGFPSGIMPLGEKAYNYFAELPLIISNALNIDLGILNIYYAQNFEKKYFEDLQNYCYQKYHFDIASFCISRQRIEYSQGDKEFEFYFLDENFLEKSFSKDFESPVPVIRLTDEKESAYIVQSLIQLLEQNLDVI